MDLISIVVPFLNEEGCILKYCDFIDGFSKDKPFKVEVVFVDDGSTDDTCHMINVYEFKYCQSVKLVQLSKNCGSHMAMRAGILHSSGDYTTFVGADLQEPDDMVSTMYTAIMNNLDAVYIEKSSVKISALENAFSSLFSFLVKRYAVEGYGSGGINNIMFNSKIKEYLNNNVELNSSLMLQIINAGFKSTTILMDYKNRFAGVSKWTLSKKIKIFIDSFVSFSFVPIRLVSIVGILMFIIGILFGISIVVNRLIHPYVPVGFPTLASLIVIGFGITNISLGIIAEYLWRTLDAARARPAFIVSDIKEIK